MTVATQTLALLTCVLLAAAGAATAQDYPARPITVLIPFPPGTGNDVVGRVVGAKVGEILNQRVVPDNRAGASGHIAIEATKRAPPDGYTVVVASSSFAINLHTMKTSVTLADFTPVSLLGKLPYTLMVIRSLPAKNIKELAALVKSRPGQFNSGSGGATGTTFFLMEAFNKATGGDVQQIAYKGTTAGVADLLAERTQMMFAPMVTSLPQYRAGKIQLHGVTGSKRNALVPEVPTFIESGYPMLDVPTWFAFLGPAGIPAGPVRILNEAAGKALAAKDVIDALSNQGVEPFHGTPAETDAFLKTENAMWARMVKEAGIKPQ